MTHMLERVRQAADQPDGGVTVLGLPPGDPLELYQAAALETHRLGFVPVLAGRGSPDLPAALLHRHVLVICADSDDVAVAIGWVRSLAQASPRRHIVARFGASRSAMSSEQPVQVVDVGVVSARLARAERWQRRGRPRMADRWLIAAAEAARRRGDSELAAFVERQVIRRLLDRDRVEEAGARARALLRQPLGWLAYADVSALWTAVLMARLHLAEAGAWLASVVAEAQLRNTPIPAHVRARSAELAFWQGRNPAAPAVPRSQMGPEELGWAALAAWSCGNLARVAALAMQLQMRLSPDDEISRRWWLLLRLVTAESAGAEETGRRVEAVVSAVRSGARVPARFRRLALAVSGRLLLAENRRDEAADLLAWERGSGPEGAACDWLRARARPDVEDRPAARRPAGRGVPGLEFLVSGSANMHLVDGLSGLLAVVEDSEDDAAVLTGGCRWVCRQAGALAVAVVSADGATLVAAENWRRADLAGEIGEVLNGPARDARQPDHDAAASSFGVSIRYGGVTIGFVVARGRAADRAALQQAAHAFAALGGSALRARLDALTVSQRAHAAVPEIVGDSPLIAAVRDAVTRAAAAPFPVLIEGESGTGKELVARALHRLGPRRDHRLSAVNCAALNDELVEAELFGHARGAFTGAVGPRTGLFEEAHGGTLFLDEVTELSPRAQAKLLRVLQEREVRRVGENVPRAIDVRLIAACNVPLADAVVSGRFRDDLRFRLAVVRIRLPALRERIEDVPALARLFWRRAAAEAGARATLGSDALVRLTQHAWPGNVRELQNVIAGLVVAAPARGRVTRRHVDQVLSHATTAGESPGVPLDAARRTFERRMIAAALVRHAGRRTAAASELGLTRQGLTKALRRLGLAAEEDAAGVA